MAAPLLSWEQYAAVWAGLHGGVDPRRARPSVRRWLRLGFHIARIFARLRVRPSAVTAVGLLLCLSVPVFAVAGSTGTLLAAGLVILAAIADTVDGALAVLTDRTTRLGYVYDSVVDRLGEVCWLIAFWRLGVPGLVVVAAAGVSWLHEYSRARANAAGMTEIGAVTVGERPTRVLIAVFGLTLAGLAGMVSSALPGSLAGFAVAVWIVTAVIGLGQLFAAIHRALAGRSWPSWRPPGSPLVDAANHAPPHFAPVAARTVAARTVADRSARRVAAAQDVATVQDVAATDVDGRDDDAEALVADLRAELAQLAELPAGATVYASTTYVSSVDTPRRDAPDLTRSGATGGRHSRLEADEASPDSPDAGEMRDSH